MSKKSKRQKQQKAASHEHGKGGNKLEGKPDHIAISGKIETDFPPKLIEKYDATSNKQDSWDRKKFRAEICTIILLFAYTSIALWQGCSTRELVVTANRTFEAANRPYVGLDGFEFAYFVKNSEGKFIKTEFPSTADLMSFNAQIKNFGPVPGTNFKATWKVFFDAVHQQGIPAVPNRPSTIFPTQGMHLNGSIGGDNYQKIRSGKIILTIEVTVEYDGPSAHYKECTKEQYSHQIGAWFELGPLCSE